MTSMRPATPSILCVDDESRVLDGLRLTLRHGFDVLTATSGAEGLAMLKRMAGATVVISDMRMPGMDGAAFLTQVKEQWPDSTRLLLTGEAGRDAAIAAVNEGQIFRFLTKPCAPENLVAAVEAAVRQHELVRRVGRYTRLLPARRSFRRHFERRAPPSLCASPMLKANEEGLRK